MGDADAINVQRLVLLDPTVSDIHQFCSLVSQTIGQGVHFIRRAFIGQGVIPRAKWAFWAPARSFSGRDGESILAVELTGDVWHASLCFHGDEELYRTLEMCAFCAFAGVGPDFYTVGRHKYAEEDSAGRVLRFDIEVPVDFTYPPGLIAALLIS